ncbi:MAG: hypothetical protein ACTS2F_07045 [Thainema sp.]
MPAPAPDSVRRQLLAEALQLSRFLVGNDSSEPRVQRRQERLREIQATLQTYAHPVCCDRSSPAQIPLKVRQAFVESVLLVTRYHRVGGMQWRGTMPSPTLSQYQPDPIPASWDTETAIATLCQQYELSTDHQAGLKTLLAQVDHQIEQQHRIMQAVLASVEITPDTEQPHLSSAARLFRYLFTIDVPVGLVQLVYTPLQVYFCVDVKAVEELEGGEGKTADGLDAIALAKLKQLLMAAGSFSYSQFQRFPTFGPCDPMQIDREWVEQVAATVRVEVVALLRSLSRAVGVIPLHKAEAFLLHDIWGHHWQLMLTQFESDYAILADCDEPLRAGETAYTPNGPLTCQELFKLTDQTVTLDVQRARLFFHGEVRQRLGLLFTHLLGEMVADAAEFKFVWDYPQAADQLLSSSLFKTLPMKLDLSLADLDFLFLRVLKPLLEMELSALHFSPLEAELLTAWDAQGHNVESLTCRTSLKCAISQLYHIFLSEYSADYLPTLAGSGSVFAEIASNLLYLQNAVNTLYTDFTSAQHPDLPFQDLLTVFISSYCSSDCYTEFWDVDDSLARYFLPCWLLLKAETASS